MALNQIKGGAILSYISIMIGNIIVLIYTPFMLRALGSSEFGIYSICNTVGSSIAMLDAGFGVAAIKYIVRDKNDKTKLPYTLGSLMLVNIFLGIIAFILTGSIAAGSDIFFAKSMNEHELSSVSTILWLTCIYIMLSFMTSVFSAVVVAFERFIFIKIVDIIKSLMLPILIVPFLLWGYKAIAMSLITLLVFILMNVAKIIFAFSHLKIRVSFKKINWDLIKQALPFAGIVVFKLLLDRIYWNGGQLVLGAVSGTIAVAIFALALQLSGYYNYIAQSINNLFLPRCSELSKNKDILGLSNLFVKVSRIQTMILGIFLCVFCVFGKLFIELWAGSEYKDAFYCCLFIMIPYTIPLTQGVGNSILQTENKLRFQTIIYSVIATCVLIMSFFLGKSFGAIGCSLSISVCILIGEICAMNYYYFKIGMDIRKFWANSVRILFPMIVVSLVFMVISYFTFVASWLYFAINVLLMTIILFIVTYRYNMLREERILFNSALNKVKSLIR
jgi:O-antigen/teichoic acid export membrane protein